MLNIDEQLRIITSGTAEVIDIRELEEKLGYSQKHKKRLVVKLGLDPTSPDLHLGNTIVLRKAKQLQDLGHRIVIILGDLTGMIGDPTEKLKTRKQLSREEVLLNAQTYKQQIFKILNPSKTEIRFNSEWLSKFGFKEILQLTSRYTVSRMLEREDFKNRFNSQHPIGIHEFLYPLMQGYDSVAVKADIEIGGNDQRFNILIGRTIQREYDMEKQTAILMPLLEGLDGVQKMSRSFGNYVGIDEDTNDIYGKIMSISDELIARYYELITNVTPNELDKIKKQLKTGIINPRDIKMNLARDIVELYHGAEAAAEAEEHFKTVFQKRLIPEDIKEVEINSQRLNNGKISMVRLLVILEFVPTNSEARRLIEQGGVKINGEKILSFKDMEIKNGDIIQAGKRNFARIVII